MKFIADLHIHSHFSRATSRDLDPENLAIWAKKKGIGVIGTGDFTHPGWVSELQEKLIEAENGLYRLRPELEKKVEETVPGSCGGSTRFLLSGEISCIYKKDGKTRKVHNLVLMPDFLALSRFNERLDRIGNITSDGRPILGLDSRDLLEIALEVSERTFFIPAHIWTPWFSLFGSKSGFDVLEDCFGDLSGHIHALETGLSSDPPMNRLLSALDGYLLVSNSDAHSPAKLGREANLFDVPFDYDRITRAMTRGKGFEGTIEFFPEEGKYHFDGHRKCQVCLHPKDTRAYNGICPACGKPLTVGVLHRVDELADRDVPELSKAFYSMIPLTEILSEILGTGPSTKRVLSAYEELLTNLGPELHILMNAPVDSIEKAGGILLARAIERMRRTQVIRQEGFDGQYGRIRLFGDSEMNEIIGQKTLFQPSEETPTFKAKSFSSGPKVQNNIYINDPVRRVDGEPVENPERHRRVDWNTHPPKAAVDPVLDPLNPAQRDAVLQMGGPLLIVAGPGTGKTMTLTHRIVHQIRSGATMPEQILALTFTNKAAGEMRERISNLIQTAKRTEGGHGKDYPNNGCSVRVATFHGFCLEVLRQDGESLNFPADFTLCSEKDVPILAYQVLTESGIGYKRRGLFLKSLPRLKMASVMAAYRDLSLNEFQPYYLAYQNKLRILNMLDLDDLEIETLRLFRDHPDICSAYARRYPKLFIDEYQDTNPIQVELLKALFHADALSGDRNSDFQGKGHQSPVLMEICAIGDPDQSIYGFRGSDVQNFHRFEDDFPGASKIVLDRNYRSTQVILDGASALMGGEKSLKGTLGKGAPINLASSLTQSEEAEMIVEQIERLLGGTTYFSLDSGRVASHEDGEDLSFGDVAILFRLNAQGDTLEEAFSRAGIPFMRSGEKPLIERYPVNVLWRLLQALQYPDNPYYRDAYMAFPDIETDLSKKALNCLNRDDPVPALIDQAVSYHEFEENIEGPAEALQRFRKMANYFEGNLAGFLDALSLERGIDNMGLSGDRVALMSLHAAKGLEWPVVIITGCEDGLIPFSLFQEGDEAEEKRLFYVGMTRARRRLILSCVSRRNINGRSLQLEPSPFLRLIPETLRTPLKRGEWKRKKPAHQQLNLF